MHHRFHVLNFACVLGTALAATGGCQHQAPRAAPHERPVVAVSTPVERMVTDDADYPGRTEAVELLDVRPRVTGYLVQMPFKEGAEVKVNELLFAIDPRPYQAQLDVARGTQKRLEGQKKLVDVQVERYTKLVAKGAASQQELDTYVGQQAENLGGLAAATAQIAAAELNLQFCSIRAPINGQISRYFLTLGNLVNADQTLLTTVVSLDPIYAYFNMDEPTLERIKRAINAGRIKSDLEAPDMPVTLGLQTEDGFPHQGTVNFINNQVNPSTGTISIRGVFPNPKSARGVRPLAPGMFVRIRIPLGAPRRALLVADRAVVMDQGLRSVYVLDAENRVQYRQVRTGPLQDDGLRVITEGLKADDRVIVNMLQQVRPHMVVDPEPVAMPTLQSAAPKR